MDPGSEQLSIDTPELVTIEMPLAGIGSRFIAVLVDMALWSLGLAGLGLLVWLIQPALQAFSRLSYQWLVALATFVVFLLNWGYFTLFEALWNGQTPGKRIARIRVIQKSGRAIGPLESMARNLVRYIDQIPFFYAVGVIAVFATREHQRLGDLAAGTLVVRDTRPASGETRSGLKPTFDLRGESAEPVLDEPHRRVMLPPESVAKLDADDLEVLEGFLGRRLDLPGGARHVLGSRLAEAISRKASLIPPPGVSTETFLEAVARDLRDVARMK